MHLQLPFFFDIVTFFWMLLSHEIILQPSLNVFNIFNDTGGFFLCKCFHLDYQKYSDFIKGAAEEQ